MRNLFYNIDLKRELSIDPDWITAGAAVVGVFAGNIILWYLQDRQHRFESLNKVYELMRDTTEDRQIVLRIYESFAKRNVDLSKLFQYSQTLKVIVTMDKIGMLYEFGALPKYAVMEMYWQSYINYWLMLQPAIEKRRRKTSDYDSTYAKYFQRLYEGALNHQREHYSRPRVTTEMQELLGK